MSNESGSDESMAKYDSMPGPVLLEEWNKEIDYAKRDLILKAMEKKGLFPAQFMKQWEDNTGAYPSNQDPLFLQKLLAKREFAESLQTDWDPGNDPCGDVNKFEVTPVQRFAANLMSPRSPYMSALLYHGVGVGKTCAAVQIAEAWLDAFPKDKIFLVAPPTIQDGFYRTIFDSTKLSVGSGPTDPNKMIGCTGDSYLEMTGMQFEKDRKRIDRQVRNAIKQRYAVFGYVSFANYVIGLLSGISEDLDEEDRAKEERRIISKKFSGKLLIIDEAHNVRDETGEAGKEEGKEEDEDFVAKASKDDMAGGKFMTEWLRKVLTYARGLKLVLLTATPMYNNYREIVFMLNLLLMNDKKGLITEDMIFRPSGRIHSKGEELLGRLASRYVSFMRGENPKSFPIRLSPELEDVPLLKDLDYPTRTPRGIEGIPEDELVFKDHLPVVTIELEGDALEASLTRTRALQETNRELKEGELEQRISGIQLSGVIQAGNFIPPSASRDDSIDVRLGKDGLNNLFKKAKSGGEMVYTSKTKRGAGWLARDEIGTYSPKFAFLLDQLASCKGVAFVYMRVVALGALPLALALEANGYTSAGRDSGLLGDGIQAEGGRQCAKCVRKEKAHKGAKHDFVPAMYGFLTGDVELTPNNKGTIAMERQVGNEDGSLMKVIIGSQIAGEGVDLRYIREVHMLDSWYHLNRTEQVIGRAIRFCSHSALPQEKRNATIHLYAAVFPKERNRETADLYSYRQAFRKAVEVGNVTRALKIRAIDCNLNHDAIIIRNQDPVTQIDSKGTERDDVDINDKPFTAICDWNESCKYKCIPKITVDVSGSDDSTYSEFAAKWRESLLKQRFKDLFAEQVFYEFASMWGDEFGDVPIAARTELFENVIDNKAFEVVHEGVKGYIKYCNGYYVFQPNVYMDLHIPLAIRAATFPVRRDQYDPAVLKVREEPEEESVKPAAKFGLVDTWNSIVEWATMLRDLKEDEEAPKKIPDPISDHLEQMANRNPDEMTRLKYVMQTIHWFLEAVIATEARRSRFYKVLLEFLWDNWFSSKEQMQLVNEEAEEALAMMEETQVEISDISVYRYYNFQDSSIMYICDGKPCSASVVKEVKKAEKRIAANFINQEDGYRVGRFYGFVTSHNGSPVFKTNKAFSPGTTKKLGGVMCGVLSGISEKHAQLLELGAILDKAGKPNLGLEDKFITKGDRKIENSVRGCTLLELVLRFMDHASINEKRWFFRPTYAKLVGHIGRFSKTTKEVEEEPKKKSIKKSAKKEESSEEDEPKLKKSASKKKEEEEPPKKSSKTLRRAKTVE